MFRGSEGLYLLTIEDSLMHRRQRRLPHLNRVMGVHATRLSLKAQSTFMQRQSAAIRHNWARASLLMSESGRGLPKW